MSTAEAIERITESPTQISALLRNINRLCLGADYVVVLHVLGILTALVFKDANFEDVEVMFDHHVAMIKHCAGLKTTESVRKS